MTAREELSKLWIAVQQTSEFKAESSINKAREALIYATEELEKSYLEACKANRATPESKALRKAQSAYMLRNLKKEQND